MRIRRQQHSCVGHDEGSTQRRAWRSRKSCNVNFSIAEWHGARVIIVGPGLSCLGLANHPQHSLYEINVVQRNDDGRENCQASVMI
jgi:hypothetical protein